MIKPACKTCDKPIYWIAGMGLWYHCGLHDSLTCPSIIVEPAPAEA